MRLTRLLPGALYGLLLHGATTAFAATIPRGDAATAASANSGDILLSTPLENAANMPINAGDRIGPESAPTDSDLPNGYSAIRDVQYQLGSMKVTSKTPLTFQYSTSQPGPKNWVGLYLASGGGPVNQKYEQNSLKWAYATASDGSVQVDAQGLADGQYKAYFLADDGYRWLANPIEVTIGKTYPGAMTLVSSSPLTVKYTTSQPASKNWIGLYRADGGGPEKGQYVSQALSWKYAPDSQGSVQIPVDGLAPGLYKAFFLANDGYEWAGEPIEVSLGGGSGYPGALTRDHSKEGAFVFQYNTTKANAKNWIGIYKAYGGGPEHESQDKPAIVWKYAPDAQGTVSFANDAIEPGPYKAFFLENDGYRWQSNPLKFGRPTNDKFQFIYNEVTGPNARRGDPYRYDISGLVTHAGDPRTYFSMIDNDGGWAKISPNGIISGTPTPGAKRNASISIHAKTAGGMMSWMDVFIPVAEENAPLVPEVKVLSFNLWFGGTPVNNYHEKQVYFLMRQNVDIIGFQESLGIHGLRLAYALGYYAWQGPDVSIISKYPIVEVYPTTSAAGSVRIALDGDRSQVIFWNCHLGYNPYGPYDFCFDRMSNNRVLEREAQSGRTPQIKEITEKMQPHLANAENVPVFLVGDFNAPSHLDWVDQTKDIHCGVGYTAWPTSIYPTDAGLIDSFRVVNTDPRAERGDTWSPIYLDNEGRKEPLDRIDFIYHKSNKLRVLHSHAIMEGNPKAEPNHKENAWPSDHKAVLTHYTIRN